MTPTRRRGWLIGLLVAVAFAAGWTVFHYRFETYHLRTVQEGVLYRDGNRGMTEFRNMVRTIQPRTVVMLVTDDNIADPDSPQFLQEIEFLRANNIRLLRLPMRPKDGPTTEDVRTFLDTVQEKSNQPVLLHCAQGVVRTGMMAAAYQESVLGWDDEKTKAEIHRFGRKDVALKRIQDFIDRYDGKTRTVTRMPEESVAGAETGQE